jgi:CheY-like chemotaxis protein
MDAARRSPHDRRMAVVLVVDDDRDIRSAISELLRDEGYATLEAPNGAVALERLRDLGAPCLMLLDLMMPVMDGFAVLDTLVRDSSLPPTNVVVMTAGNTDRRDLGEVPLLRKPLDLDDLLGAVKRHCHS